MKIREHGNESPISAKWSCRVEVENQPSLAEITESEAEADHIRGLIRNVAVPIAPYRTVDDVDYVLGEAAETLRDEVKRLRVLRTEMRRLPRFSRTTTRRLRFAMSHSMPRSHH